MSTKHGGLIVDLGNVIVAYWLSNITPQNINTIDYNAIPEVPRAFETLKRFNKYFDGNVTVVYKATGIAMEKIDCWLVSHRFSERTGIPISRVVHSTGGRNKTFAMEQSNGNYCGTTIVVDDRLEVLSYFVNNVHSLFLFRPQPQEVEAFRHTGALAYVRIVQTWQEIERISGI